MDDFGDFLQQYHLHMFAILKSRYGLPRSFVIDTSSKEFLSGGALDSNFFDQNFRSAIKAYMTAKLSDKVQFKGKFRVVEGSDLHISFPLIVREGAMLRKFLQGSTRVTLVLNADAKAQFLQKKPTSISVDFCKDCLFLVDSDVLAKAIAKFEYTVHDLCATNVVAKAQYFSAPPQQQIAFLAGWAARYDFSADAG